MSTTSSPPSSSPHNEFTDLLSSFAPTNLYKVIDSPTSDFDEDALAAFVTNPEKDPFSQMPLHKPIPKTATTTTQILQSTLQEVQNRIHTKTAELRVCRKETSEEVRRTKGIRSFRSYGDINNATTLSTPGWAILQKENSPEAN